jgi:ATP-binding cassette subfamily B protein
MDDVDSPPGRSRGIKATVRKGSAACALAVRAAPGLLTISVLIVLVTGALPVVTAWLTKVVIDSLVDRSAASALVAAAVGLGTAGLLLAVMPQIMQYVRAQLQRETGLLADASLFAAVDRFVGLGRFENPRFLDRLRLARESGGAAPGEVVDGITGLARASITVAGFLGSLFLLSPLMTAVVVLAGVPTVVAEIALSRRRARMSWEIGPIQRREMFYGTLLSSVNAAKEVRLFGIGTFLRERMLTERRTANAAKRDLDLHEVFVQAGLGLLAAVISAGGLLWAVNAARRGDLSVGDISVFVAATAGVQTAIAMLVNEIARAHFALLMFEHYLTVTTAGPDLPTAANPRRLGPLRQGIELRDVWFRYSEEHPWALRGVNLRIPYGKAIALVGLNGAGKSTLVKLLCRFYDPDRGEILWDGVDISEADAGELRRRISAVFQDYMKYDLTAAENIALGDLHALDDCERTKAAAERAGIHDKLATLPKGYDTLLSRMFFTEADKDKAESGVVLSGGQWQRLALARAFLREDPDVTILDEPSAGLDAEAEHEIHASLKHHRMGRTSVLISHRLGAVRDADLIVVLDEGQVLEEGDHDSLLAARGEYARLFALQASGYQAAEHGAPVLVEQP